MGGLGGGERRWEKGKKNRAIKGIGVRSGKSRERNLGAGVGSTG